MPIGATRLGYRFLPIPPSDGSGPPRPQYFNSSFEAGSNGWTVIPTRIILGTTTILGYTVPGTEPTPVQTITKSSGGVAKYYSTIEKVDVAWHFNGTNNSLTIPNNSLTNLGGGDFTIEAWINLDTTTGFRRIFSKQSTAGLTKYNYVVRISPTTNFVYFEIDVHKIIESTTSLSINTWYHFAIVRSASTVNLYINGILDATASYTDIPNDINALACIGAYTSPFSEWFRGYISNLRFVKGTAVYTGDFTPSSLNPTQPILNPTQPIGTNIAEISGTNTVLLTLQNSTIIDNSSNGLALSGAPTPPVLQTVSHGGNSCLKLFSDTMLTSVAGATVYGPAVYSNVAVIAEVGDSITYSWKAVSGGAVSSGDAYRSLAYLLDKRNGRIITMFTAAGLSVDAATVWQTQTRIFQEGEEGEYHFVFVSGSQDSTNGKILGASLLIDNVALIKA